MKTFSNEKWTWFTHSLVFTRFWRIFKSRHTKLRSFVKIVKNGIDNPTVAEYSFNAFNNCLYTKPWKWDFLFLVKNSWPVCLHDDFVSFKGFCLKKKKKSLNFTYYVSEVETIFQRTVIKLVLLSYPNLKFLETVLKNYSISNYQLSFYHKLHVSH